MKVIIFGSGQGGQMAAQWLSTDWELLAFADNDKNKQGSSSQGISVINPDRIPSLSPDLVWIAVLNRDAALKIELQLRELGYGGPLQTLQPFRDLMDLRLAHTRLFAAEIRRAGIPGAVAELGVYQGAFAAEINRLFPDRTLYLFDTFTGFSSEDVAVERELNTHTKALAGNFADTGVALVRNRLPYPEKAVFCQGHFPETLPDDLPPLVFVSLDPDLYEPTLAGLRAFWPKLIPGGLIMIHDYNSFQFEGVKKAVQIFCGETGLSVFPLADLHGSAVLIKPKSNEGNRQI